MNNPIKFYQIIGPGRSRVCVTPEEKRKAAFVIDRENFDPKCVGLTLPKHEVFQILDFLYTHPEYGQFLKRLKKVSYCTDTYGKPTFKKRGYIYLNKKRHLVQLQQTDELQQIWGELHILLKWFHEEVKKNVNSYLSSELVNIVQNYVG